MAKKPHVVDVGELKSFHEEFNVSRQGLNDLNSHHGEILKRMEQQGYHREAFKLVAKVLRYDIEKAQDFVRAYHLYSDILGLDKHVSLQSDLLDDEAAEETAAVA